MNNAKFLRRCCLFALCAVFTISTTAFGLIYSDSSKLEGYTKRTCNVESYTVHQIRSQYNGSIYIPPKCDVKANLDCMLRPVVQDLGCDVEFCADSKPCQDRMPINSSHVYWLKENKWLTSYEYERLKLGYKPGALPLLLLSIIFLTTSLIGLIYSCVSK